MRGGEGTVVMRVCDCKVIAGENGTMQQKPLVEFERTQKRRHVRCVVRNIIKFWTWHVVAASSTVEIEWRQSRETATNERTVEGE